MLNIPLNNIDRRLARAAYAVDALWTPPLTEAEKAARHAERTVEAAQAKARWESGVRKCGMA